MRRLLDCVGEKSKKREEARQRWTREKGEKKYEKVSCLVRFFENTLQCGEICKTLFHHFHKNRKPYCRVCVILWDNTRKRPKLIRWDFTMRYFQLWDKKSGFVICTNTQCITTFYANEQASTAPHWTSVQMQHLSLQKQHSLNICISQTGFVCRVSATLNVFFFFFFLLFFVRVWERSESGSPEWFSLMHN